MKPARMMRVPLSVPSWIRLRRASSSSVSLARSRTVVTPAARFSKPSLPLTWACMSQSPGINVFPEASMTSSCFTAAGSRFCDGLMLEILFPVTRTSWSGRILPASASKTLACWKRTPFSGRCASFFARSRARCSLISS